MAKSAEWLMVRQREVAHTEALRLNALRTAAEARERKRAEKHERQYPPIESVGAYAPTLAQLQRLVPALGIRHYPDIDTTDVQLGREYLRAYLSRADTGTRCYIGLLESNPSTEKACAVQELLRQVRHSVYKSVILNPTPNSTLAATVARVQQNAGPNRIQDWIDDVTGEVLVCLLEQRPIDCAPWARMYYEVAGGSIYEVACSIMSLPRKVAQAVAGKVRRRARVVAGYNAARQRKLQRIVERWGEERVGRRIGLWPAPRIHNRLYYRSTSGAEHYTEVASAASLQAYSVALDAGLIRLVVRERVTTGTQGVRGWVKYKAKQVALKQVGSYTLGLDAANTLPGEDLSRLVELRTGPSRREQRRIAAEVECWARRHKLSTTSTRILISSILVPDAPIRAIAAAIGTSVSAAYKARERYLCDCARFVLQGVV